MIMFVTLAQAGLMLQNRLPEIAVLQVQEECIVAQAAVVAVVHTVILEILIIIRVKCVAPIAHHIIIRVHMESPALAAMQAAHM